MENTNNNTDYNGPDLDIFRSAHNWHSYLSHHIANHISGNVLEVGAGIGSLTKRLLNGPQKINAKSWLCLEPDQTQGKRLSQKIETCELPSICSVASGTIYNLDSQSRFDTIIYIDVLEHIELDADELKHASSILKPGGKLVVLAPAHNWLFSELDTAAGHYRRYSRPTLVALTPHNLQLLKCVYIDSVGICASMANRYLLRKDSPGGNQIKLWDNVIIPMSRIFDPITGYNIGKSVIAVWQLKANVAI